MYKFLSSNKDSISFDIHPSPVISLIEEDSICIGNSVQLLPSVSSGTQNFNYSWTVSDSSLSSYNILSPVASPIATANYILTVTDIYSCQDSESITVEVLDLPVVDAGPDQNKCFLDTALFNASISGAIPPYSFLWSPAGFLINDNILNPSQTFHNIRCFPNECGGARWLAPTRWSCLARQHICGWPACAAAS